MKRMWKFQTAHFVFEWAIEREPLDTYYMDLDLAKECKTKVKSGEWKCFTSVVRVIHRATRKVLSEVYLGNSIYADPADFRDHFGSRRGGWGSYFSDMVREAVSEARK